MPYFTHEDGELFRRTVHYDIYKKLGAHLFVKDGVKGVYFNVWAPNAKQVFVEGEFNNWDGTQHEMHRVEPIDMGVYELFIPGIQEGDTYQYCVVTSDGNILHKSDPYGNYAEVSPKQASVVTDITKFIWTDGVWMKQRRDTKNSHNKPMAIYEVHLGSWKKPKNSDNQFFTYRDLAKILIDYVCEMGYTHIELMGILEHPYDGSWGYQVTGYYAPTSRYGTPKDFAYFINECHKRNIGVILDWMPAHFPKDAHGLAHFDGTNLYEYEDTRKREHPHWGTYVFDYGKSEVKNFLIGSALMWIEHFHIDALRVDAVASMLYLDYGRGPGEWEPNEYGGKENLEAVEFLKHLNSIISKRNPGAITIAEESSAWPGVTKPAEEGGLNFTFKWNMGWMHDCLNYMQTEPFLRGNCHHNMTFPMSYHESENFILPLSHDEVVHEKGTLMQKMPGSEEDKIKNIMALYAFMMGHSGKKLLFMGQEFAQKEEWSEIQSLDWDLLENPNHKKVHRWVKELLKIYRENRCMYELDANWNGFEWMNADDKERSIYSFVRRSKDGKNNLLFMINFTPVERSDYQVGVPKNKSYELILNSEDFLYPRQAGNAMAFYRAKKESVDGRPYSLSYELPPYGVAVFKF